MTRCETHRGRWRFAEEFIASALRVHKVKRGVYDGACPECGRVVRFVCAPRDRTVRPSERVGL